jgi:hypothetical protein
MGVSSGGYATLFPTRERAATPRERTHHMIFDALLTDA